MKKLAEGESWEEIADYYISEPPGYEGKELIRSMASALYGEIAQGSMAVGQVVGLIRDVPTCQELIERIVAESQAVMNRLGMTFNKKE